MQVSASNCTSPEIAAAAAFLETTPGGHGLVGTIDVDGVGYWVVTDHLGDAYGLRWNVTSLTPLSCLEGYGIGDDGMTCELCDFEAHLTSPADSAYCDVCEDGYFKYAKHGELRCAACKDDGDCSDLHLNLEGPESLVHVGFFGGFAVFFMSRPRGVMFCSGLPVVA